MKRTGSKSIYSRSLFSIMLIGLTGLLMFSALFIPRFLNVVWQNERNQHRYQLEQTGATVNNLLETLENLRVAIGVNDSLHSYQLRNGETLSVIQASKELQKYTATAPIIYNLFFYIYGSDKIVGRDSVYKKSDFASTVQYYPDFPQEDLFRILEDPGSGAILPSMKVVLSPRRAGTRVLSVILPISSRNSAPYGSLLIQLDEKALAGELQKSQSDGSTVVLMSGETLLFSSSTLEEETLAALTALPASGSGETVLLESLTDRLAYSLYPVSSQKTPLRCFILSDRKSLSASVYATVISLILWFCLGLWVLVLASFVVARYNYRPIRAILEMFGIPVTREMLGRINEAEMVTAAFQQIRINTQTYVRESLVNRLLTGQYESTQALRDHCDRAGIDPAAAKYFSFILPMTTENRTPMETDALAGTLEEGAKYYLLRSLLRNCYCGILACSDPDTDAQRLSEAVCARMEALLGFPVTLFFSRPVTQIEDVADAYAEISKKSAPLRLLPYRTGVIRYDDEVPDAIPDDIQTRALLTNLGDAITQQSRSQLLTALQTLTAKLEAKETSLPIARSVGLDACAMLLQELHRLKVTSPTDVADFNPLVSPWTETKSSVAKTLLAMGDRLAAQYDKQDNQLKNVWMEDILLYIENHLLDYDFSAYTVAEAFSMSLSTFSHAFKRNMNETFQNYTNRLKVQIAKHLLTETDLSLNEIADHLRYSNPSNFGRMFKAETQMTPNSFRNEYGIQK